MRRTMIFKSQWGWLGVAESERGLVGIVLPQVSRARVEAGLRARASASRGTVSLLVASPLPMSSASACLIRSFTRQAA